MIRILIADDHPIFRNGLKDILVSKMSNAIIDDVEDGQLAWEYLNKNRVDVSVLDVDMPNMDGLEVCKRVKESAL